MSKFNVGDKVRIARTNRYLGDWQDFEAEVLEADEGNGPYLKPLSERPWGEGSLYWPAKDLELVTPAKPTLREALDTLKEQAGLCGRFDKVVDMMLDDDPLPRLHYAARMENEDDLITKLDKILNPPVKPKHVYKVGDWVRTPTGKVGRLAYISIFRDGQGDVHDAEGKHLWGGLISDLEPSAPAVPEKGRWIRATTRDGKTHEFEVTTNELNWAKVYLLAPFPNSTYTNFFIESILHREAGEGGNQVIDWEYIEAPKPPAKVGDTFSVREEVPVNGLYRDSDGHKAYRVKFTPKGAPNLFKGPGPFTLVWIDDDSTE